MIKEVLPAELAPNKRYIAFNARIGGSRGCVALYLGRDTWTCDTSSGPIRRLPHSELGSYLDTASHVFAAETLTEVARYFQVLRDCGAGEGFTRTTSGSVELRQQLAKLHSLHDEILALPRALKESIDTDLDPMTKGFVGRNLPCRTKKERLFDVLNTLDRAVDRYLRLPRLAPFFVPNERGEDPQKAGAVFQRWALNQQALTDEIEAVAEEIKPLHMAGVRWVTNLDETDQRRLSMDIVASFRGSPVVVEVKMDGDSYTTEALPQLLRYGAMVTPPHQRQRFRGLGIAKTDELWLAIATESRNEVGYDDDYLCAVEWLNESSVKQKLGNYFNGVFVLRYDSSGGAWQHDEGKSVTVEFV